MQKLAKRLNFQGLDLRIEYPKGAKRSYQDDQGKTQYKTMRADYGEVRGTKGLDGDAVDVYVGPHKESDRVFVITQMKKNDWSKVDEEKCILGTRTRDEAQRLYLAHYDDPRFLGSIKEIGMKTFQDRLESRGAIGEKIASSAERIAELNYMRLQQGAPVLLDHQHGVKTSALDEDDKRNLRSLGSAATNPLVVGGAAGVGTGLAVKGPRVGRVGAGVLAGLGAHHATKKVREGVNEVRDYRARRALERAYGEGYKSSAYAPWSPEIERAQEAQRKFAGSDKDPDPEWDVDLPDEVKKKMRKEAPQRLEDMRRSAIAQTEVTKQEQLGLGIKETDVKDNPKDSKMRKAAQLAQIDLFVKQAGELTPRQQRIANTIDNVGILGLASPYIGAGLNKHLAHKPGLRGAIGQAGGRFAQAFPLKNRREIGALALVSHAGMDTGARGIDKLLPKEKKIERAKELAKVSMAQKHALSLGTLGGIAGAASRGLKNVAGRIAGRATGRAAGSAAGQTSGSLAQATLPGAAKTVSQAAAPVVQQAPKSSLVFGKATSGAPAHANSPAAQRARAQIAAQQNAAAPAATAPVATAAPPAHAGSLSTTPGASIGLAAPAPVPSLAPGNMTIPSPPRLPTNIGTVPPPGGVPSMVPPPASGGTLSTTSIVPGNVSSQTAMAPTLAAPSVPGAPAAVAQPSAAARTATVAPPAPTPTPASMPAASTPASTPVVAANQPAGGLKLTGADAIEGRPGSMGAPAAGRAAPNVVQVKGQNVLADANGMPIVDAKGNYVSPELTRGQKILQGVGGAARGVRNAGMLGVGAVGLGLGAGTMGAAHLLSGGGHEGLNASGYAPPNA